jgi:hypothetical protein
MYDDDDWSDWYEDGPDLDWDWEDSDNPSDESLGESDLVSDLGEKVDHMMTDPGYYDRIVGWF